MASSGSVFSETLQAITTTKLEELDKQRLAFETQHAALIEAADKEPDALERLFLLVEGAKACLGVMTVPSKRNKGGRGRVLVGATSNPRVKTDLKNLDRFLEQARYDPSVSPRVLEDWEKSIRRHLSVQSTKYQYADLYGKLVTEWLSSGKSEPADGDIEMSESFEEVPGVKKMQARAEWEKVVFESATVDVEALKAYLKQLFVTSDKDVANAMGDFREKVEQFENRLATSLPFDNTSVRWVIQGLQASDLFDNEKREVLKDFLTNDVILAEISDVLNMRMAALSRWTWGDHVPLEQRRMLSGGYSIHMHEDVLQAIFLHYIGVEWSVFFKTALLAFRDKAGKSNHVPMPKLDRLRRDYYLGPAGKEQHPNLDTQRAMTHRSRYFAYQLLDHEKQLAEVQEGEEEADFCNEPRPMPPMTAQTHPAYQPTSAQYPPAQAYNQQMQLAGVAPQRRKQAPPAYMAAHAANMAMVLPPPPPPLPTQYSDYDHGGSKPNKRPIQAKQDLLHLLSTEIVINTRLHGELTCFHSVFDSWNPLLPHSTILAVLEFLGVSEKWRTFFKTFLEAPLKFTDEQSDPRPRRRGTPGSHALSDVFGEVVLACLDFSVNKATNGGMLYRLYDDIWFWSKNYETCVQAWACVTQFAEVMGVQINEAKSGSVRVHRDSGVKLPIDERLPQGNIRWGFLYLDSTTGHFEIDEKMVATSIEELRKQLQSKSKSVIDWIQAWNTYATTFFSSNFGKAANCFGREHVDKMLATHRHIQSSIFDGGNVVQFLKDIIAARFGVADVPDGFLFFPVELGGLDLQSPFVGLLQIREAVVEDPALLLDTFFEAERKDYTTAQQAFDRGDTARSRWSVEDAKFLPEEPDVFFPFDEFVRFRESYRTTGTADLLAVYRDLMKRPEQESVDGSVLVRRAVEQLSGQSGLRAITGDWEGMEAYWKWVAQMYGPEMVERFGGLNVVDPGQLPIGMVSLLREKRIKWQG